jgi:hypothetical protein
VSYALKHQYAFAVIYFLSTVFLVAISVWFFKNAAEKIISIIVLMVCPFGLMAQNANTFVFKKAEYTNTPLGDSTKKEKKQEYLDTIYLGTTKTAFIDIKGFEFSSGDLGSGNNGIIKLAVQENSHVLKLHATKNFPETNLFLTAEDTSVQFLIRYLPDPPKNYYSYYLGGIRSTLQRQYDSLLIVSNLAKGILKKEDSAAQLKPIPSADSRTVFEKNAAQMINPKNKLFSQVRSKNQNVNFGVYHKNVRIFVEKLYRSGTLTYIMVKVINHSMGEFQLEDIAVFKSNGSNNIEEPIQIINEEAAYNLLKKGEKNEFVLIPDLLDLELNESLIFNFKSGDPKDNTFKFVITAKDFKKRETL